MDTERIDVRREPLVVRDGCAPGRTPPGRWPSDEALVRSEQFAVNEALASLTAADGVFGVHAPPGTGVAEVFGDLVAAVVTERARRIADLADPSDAFGEARAWGAHTVTAPAPELAGFEIVLAVPEAGDGLPRPGLGLPPIGAAWRERAARADYFASTARLADGVGAWAMLAARLGDRPANRAFAERWWHGAVRGTDVLFPAGESMAAALARLKGTAVYWPACVAWFRSALGRAEHLAAERMNVAAALSRLSVLEQACEEAAVAVEAARSRLAEVEAREPAARDAARAAEEEYRAALALLGAHELGRPELTTVTPRGVAALRSRGALSVAVAGGVRRGRNWRTWSAARRELRSAAAAAERHWEQALGETEALRADVAAARTAAAANAAELSRLAGEMEPLAALVAAGRERWGDCVPVGPSQAETEDPALIEWRETSAPWADPEYTRARAETFIAALELHKALIVARSDIVAANLAALMELISADAEALPATGDDLAEIRLAAWQSFFLVAPVVQVPFEAARTLHARLAPGALGWLLAADTEQLPAGDGPSLRQPFRRAVFAGGTVSGDDPALGDDTVLADDPVFSDDPVLSDDTAFSDDTVLAGGTGSGNGGGAGDLAESDGLVVPRQPSAQDLADRLVRYGTWLSAGPSADRPDGSEPSAKPGDAPARWVGTPLRVVRGQDRATVNRRNDLGYDGLLVPGQD